MIAPAKRIAPSARVANELKSSPSTIRPVKHEAVSDTTVPSQQGKMGTLTIDGQQYQIQLMETSPNKGDVVTAKHSQVGFRRNGMPNELGDESPPNPIPLRVNGDRSNASNGGSFVIERPVPEPVNTVELNLPSALAMVGGQHPAVGFAQWRVQEAYAQLARAEILWLPSIQAGFSFDRHDGNLQASDGNIVDVNRNSFQYGLGAGAVGAGATQRPGLVAQFHMADAIFEPKIAEKRAWGQRGTLPRLSSTSSCYPQRARMLIWLPRFKTFRFWKSRVIALLNFPRSPVTLQQQAKV